MALPPQHVKMRLTASDGSTSTPEFTLADLQAVTRKLKGKTPMKHDKDFAAAADHAYAVTADELRQFIERYEHLAAEKAEIADQQKEVMAEAKGRGYDTKALRKIIALRKQDPDQRAEEEAVLEMYKSALGMV